MTSLFCLRRSERGCPIPPPAPSTATLVWRAAEEENWRVLASERAAERANIVMVVEEDGGGGRGECVRRDAGLAFIRFGAVRAMTRLTPRKTDIHLAAHDDDGHGLDVRTHQADDERGLSAWAPSPTAVLRS